MLHEILKQSWVYQEAVQEAVQEAAQENLQKGEQIGLQKGEQKGIVEGTAEGIVRYVELRFPSLLPQTQAVLTRTTTLGQLQALQSKLYIANTLEEAEAALQ